MLPIGVHAGGAVVCRDSEATAAAGGGGSVVGCEMASMSGRSLAVVAVDFFFLFFLEDDDDDVATESKTFSRSRLRPFSKSRGPCCSSSAV